MNILISWGLTMARGDTAAKLILGDPVPWFSARTLSGAPFDLHVAAGRWIVLCFLGSPADPRAQHELGELLNEAHRFEEDRLVFHGVFTAPPADPAPYANGTNRALSFLADYDGTISRAFGAT